MYIFDYANETISVFENKSSGKHPEYVVREENGKIVSIEDREKMLSLYCSDDAINIIAQKGDKLYESYYYYNDNNEVEHATTMPFGKDIDIRDTKASPCKIVEDLVADIYDETKIFGMPVANPKLLMDVKDKITPKNVLYVLDQYKNNKPGRKDDDEDLITAIIQEVGLDKGIRLGAVRHIVNCLLEKADRKGVYTKDLQEKLEYCLARGFEDFDDVSLLIDTVEQLEKRIKIGKTQFIPPDGKINNFFAQGAVGDCWLLASIQAIRNNFYGYEIINDCVSVDPQTGVVTVTLRGVNKTYKISPKELEGCGEYATGDADVRSIEIAVARYLFETNKESIDGNKMDVAYKILVGGEVEAGDSRYFVNNLLKDKEGLVNKLKSGNYILTVSCHASVSQILFGDYQEGQQKSNGIVYNHAYSVNYIYGNTVYLVNPWNTDVEIEMSLDEFIETFDYFALLKIK